ncbi:G-protein coupled receptors family 1 profile domain-containing protein [Caenorhabditis elegans]|uniref:G-protein coupled receptors family 1 profile domain-containing protein n=1 Tax=Caenorhabditis elegans TaxID=6239 RepID=Q20355_CAEEL|nr:G-protein coupled receptors family 1 profile domain-containing protein [Caenorhabditis elegans]CAA98479.2 G-protein coupled receptors family 1 profile domain-containing protein [Caenorhabditis elegans]|eukprot:NP_505939.2 Serpentine Receptor, class X [Caenorhabditis elegans]
MSDEYNYTDPLNLSVAILILIIGIFGITCNSAIVYIFLKENSEKTALNIICFFRAVSNIIILINAFMITFLPKIILGFSIFPLMIESWLINTSTTLYLGNEYQIVLIALNRFCALFFPMKYSKIFSVFNTTAVLASIYIYRIAKKVYDVIPQQAKNCHALFSPETLSWYYEDPPRCNWVDDALEVIIYTFIVILILNSITLIKILHFYKDSLYLIDLTFTFKLSSWSDHRVWTYISGTLIWECLHSVDGFVRLIFVFTASKFRFIMVIFNDRLSFLKKKLISSSAVPIMTAPQLRRGTISVATNISLK